MSNAAAAELPKVTTDLDTAKATCEAINAAPLPEGKAQRTPHKVYVVKFADVSVYSVAQAPQPALYQAHTHELFKASVELVGAAPVASKVESYLAKLTPEQLAEAKKYLGIAG